MVMRFEVPQFIDVKDKIFGPFTLNQFIFLAGGFGLGYVAFKLIPSFLKYPAALVPIVTGLAMAFYKVNGRPFPLMVQAFFAYLFSKKLFIWNQRLEDQGPSKLEMGTGDQKSDDDEHIPASSSDTFTYQRLQDLAWNLDILEEDSDII